MKENLSFFVTPEHTSYFEAGEIPVPKEDEVVVKTAVTGICGSDIHYYLEGKVGAFALTKPYIPGHESSGIIHAVGAKVTRFRIGQRVIVEPGIPCRVCRNCMEGRYNLCENYVFMSGPTANGTFRRYFPIRADMLHCMPDEMSFEKGALVEPLAVAMHVLKRAGSVVGKTIAIFGIGPIGLLVGMTAKALGCGKVICIDINPDRLQVARACCADVVINSMEEMPWENAADVVFETAGSPVTVAQAFRTAAPGGTIVQVGWLKKDVAEINTSLLLAKELNYVASYNYANDFPAAIELLNSGRVDAERIVTHRFAFENADEAIAYTANNPKDVLKTLVIYDMREEDGGDV